MPARKPRHPTKSRNSSGSLKPSGRPGPTRPTKRWNALWISSRHPDCQNRLPISQRTSLDRAAQTPTTTFSARSLKYNIATVTRLRFTGNLIGRQTIAVLSSPSPETIVHFTDSMKPE